MRAYISSILRQALDDEIINTNPAAQTGRYIKSQEKEEINPLSQEEVDIFEEAVKIYYPRYYPFFLCALRTGIRKGELIALKPEDIDFNGKFIEVKRHWYRGSVTTPKSGKSRRVDMSQQLKEVLSHYLIQRKKEALKKGMVQPS